MKYYTITKNNQLIGIGTTEDVSIPKSDVLYKYKEVTKKEYEILNNKEFKKI
jgi:hypothetical protein